MSVKKELLTVNLDELIPYENNPRNNDNAVDYVVASIEQTADLDPIEVDENMEILSGHTRLKALKQLGYKTADVIRYSGLTDEQKRKYRILANKTGEFASWDFEKLQEELDELDFDGFDFGFEFDDINYLDMMEDKFGTGGEGRNDGFTVVSLTFEEEEGKEVRSFIKRHEQDGIVKMIIDYVRGYNA